MTLPSVVQAFKNQLRAVMPTISEKAPPPCLLSTQPGCLALAMALLAQPEKQTSTTESQTRLIITPTEEEAEQLYEDIKFCSDFLGVSHDNFALFPPGRPFPITQRCRHMP